MRPGSDQRPRGRYNSNRLLQQPQRNQFFDSNGPNIKIRGNAHQLVERYVGLAIGGDRIAAENFNQHAEHYLRVANASREGNQQGAPRPSTPADIEMSPSETGSREVADRSQPRLNVDDPDSMNHVGNDRGDSPKVRLWRSQGPAALDRCHSLKTANDERERRLRR